MENTYNCESSGYISIVDSFSDYRGRPILRHNSGGWRSAFFIIGAGQCQAFAGFGVSSNLVSYLIGPLGQPMSTAAQNVNTWTGVSYLFPLLGAFIADSFLGRYNTIIIASSFSILAHGLLTLSAEVSSKPEIQVYVFFFSIYLMAIALGGHSSCVQAFGADQFDGRDPKECKAKSSFFNWWYFGLCASMGVSILLLSYIQEYLSWGLGFGIPCISMVIALLIFLSGTTTYRFSVKTSDKNPFFRISRVYVRAARNWRALSTEVERENNRSPQSAEQFRYLHKALLTRADSDNKNGECDITDVEDARAFLRLVPIWLSSLIYAVVYAQMSTFFIGQGKIMDRTIWTGFQIPAASLQVFVGLTMVCFVPFYEQILVPLTRALTRNHSGITTLQRIGFGIFLSTTTMAVAALVEAKRLKTAFENGLVDFPEAIVPMSVFWLVPQFILLGISDLFTFVGLQEFFYDEVAVDMKSLGFALSNGTAGVGNFLSVFLIYVIKKVTGKDGGWLCNNLNKAHLDYYYLLLVGLSIAGLVMYIYFAKSYIYRG